MTVSQLSLQWTISLYLCLRTYEGQWPKQGLSKTFWSHWGVFLPGFSEFEIESYNQI